MASLPAQSSSSQRQRSSPSNQTAEPTLSNSYSDLGSEQEASQPAEAEGLAEEIQSPNESKQTSSSTQNQSQTTASTKPPSEPRQCWICFDDETEDTPLSSEWRSPCPCALTAHESCLLDWVANLENPKSRSRNTSEPILCPQCKSEIVVERPRSLVLDGVRAVDRALDRMVLPAAAITVLGTLWSGCLVHGTASFAIIFGVEDAERILLERAAVSSFEIFFGLPSIPVALIFSRHHWSDFALPFSSLLMLAAHVPEGQDFEVNWPPDAPTVFGFLPVVKTIYNMSYEKLFGDMERKWIAELRPRATEGDGTQGAGQGQNGDAVVEIVDEDNDGDVLVNVDVELIMGAGGDDDEEEEEQGENAAGGNARPNGAAGANGQQAPGQNGNNNPAGAAQQQQAQGQILGRHQEDIIIEGSTLASEVFSALILPTVSATVGGLLKYSLPLSWTSKVGKGRPGLLQTRWGRSVIGGCLFVVLKDLVVLYSRWKLAQTHRKRRILDYDPKRAKPAATS